LSERLEEVVLEMEIQKLGGTILSIGNDSAHLKIEGHSLLALAQIDGVTYVDVGGAFGSAGS